MGQSMALLMEDLSMGQIMVRFMVVLTMVPTMMGTPLLEDSLSQDLTTPLQVTFPLNPAIPFHPHLVGWDDMDLT